MLQIVSSTLQRRTRKAIAMTDDKSPLPESAFPEKEVKTNPGNPKYDTSFLDQNDSTFAEAVKIVAAAANDINQERRERRAHEESERTTKQMLREQQDAILVAIQNADKNNTANYELLASELKLLKQSDINQDQKIAQLEKLPSTMEERIAALREEILDKLPEMLKAAIGPFIDRLEALEKENTERHAAAGS